MAGDGKTLTDKQQKFVSNYVSNGFNASQAARDAGYSDKAASSKTTHMVTKHPMIRDRIARAYETISTELEIELGVTMADKMRVLSRIIYEIVPIDGAIDKPHLPQALKAMVELSKMQGHYAPDRRLSVTVDATKERMLEAQRVYEEY
jgi:hypothetical protein